jgi:hypothetical protein
MPRYMERLRQVQPLPESEYPRLMDLPAPMTMSIAPASAKRVNAALVVESNLNAMMNEHRRQVQEEMQERARAWQEWDAMKKSVLS